MKEEKTKGEKSCGAVIVTKDFNYVLIKHHAGHWDFPKGHIEKGESEEETALREIMEETGLKVELIQGFKETVHYTVKDNIPKEVVYFLAKTSSSEIINQEEEISDSGIFSEEDALKTITFSENREILKKAASWIRMHPEKLK